MIATEATQPTIPPVLARPKNSEEPWHLGRDNVRPTPNAADFLYDELSPGMVEVGVGAASDIDPTLEKAIQSVSQAAIQHKTGIMVTRTGTGRYVVRAHPAFPSGLSASGTDEVGPCRHTNRLAQLRILEHFRPSEEVGDNLEPKRAPAGWFPDVLL